MSEKRIINIKGEEETYAFGAKLADKLKPGTVIAMVGDLGTGKTTLTKAIAKGLGVKETITSPTFTIVKEYEDGKMPLYHFDVYRIGDIDEMYELGYEEYFYGQDLIAYAPQSQVPVLPVVCHSGDRISHTQL